MSTYYYFYLGKMKDGKVEPVGPYDKNGKLLSMFYLCGTTYDMGEYFYKIWKSAISDELKKSFPQSSEDEELFAPRVEELRVCSFSKLPNDDFVKSGYFLIDDVNEYMETGYKSYYDDIFYDTLKPEIYVAKMANELKFGPPKHREDEFGNDITPHSCGDYMYFAYPDYNSKEYLVHRFKQVVDMFDYDYDDYVVIMEIC